MTPEDYSKLTPDQLSKMTPPMSSETYPKIPDNQWCQPYGSHASMQSYHPSANEYAQMQSYTNPNSKYWS